MNLMSDLDEIRSHGYSYIAIATYVAIQPAIAVVMLLAIIIVR